jgi:hypothetical protein
MVSFSHKETYNLYSRLSNPRKIQTSAENQQQDIRSSTKSPPQSTSPTEHHSHSSYPTPVMIDPVTVLGLVAAIISIVDKTREIATILVTYKNDSAELETIISSLTLRLPLLAEILRKIKQATTEEQIRSQRAVLNECSRRMADLYERLEKLRPKDREGRIAKMKRKSDERERIGEIKQRMLDLEVFIQTLTTYHQMIYMERTDLYTVRDSHFPFLNHATRADQLLLRLSIRLGLCYSCYSSMRRTRCSRYTRFYSRILPCS